MTAIDRLPDLKANSRARPASESDRDRGVVNHLSPNATARAAHERQIHDLNRHFASIPAELKLRDGDDAEPVIGATTSVHWVDLLGSHRVVILAEPGAGKTWEIRHAAERLRAEGKAAFFLRLEHVATDITLAFDVGTHAEFVSWLNGRDEGWIFLDSVDEARLADPRDFDLALRRFGDAINGQGQRAHIYITSRLHEWRWVSDAPPAL